MQECKSEFTNESVEMLLARRGERFVLDLQKKLGRVTFRYVLSAEEISVPGRPAAAPLYSLYIEYKDDKDHIVRYLPAFTREGEEGKAYCRSLAQKRAQSF